ncbi:trypsin-like serine peptidase [Palleronia abyssalis]|uniref:Peptidase S1 domain-containing protein n=1 Tax=Palleronia abyssalis TaxID=1501240 RepID=A0A2R8C055_9RHOB|nr:trypsin-like serine protease [Palleronia abyssalis]SPJ25759.1 hypothetical protein PAA8504_03610 [Palleronia abyssalis]
MRIFTVLRGLVLTFLLGGPAVAGDSALRDLSNGDDSRPFRAVGRLEVGGNNFCTATLIEERVVLTAAHCVVRTDGTTAMPGDIRFLAGFRDGRADAYRTGRRLVVAKGYRPDMNDAGTLAHDVALIELDRPVDTVQVAPIPMAQNGTGAAVGVVSYAHDRADRPSLQEECSVLGRDRGALIMSCEADYGTSGAPVLSFAHGGVRIVSVVSAMANAGAQKVSIGTDLAATLPTLRAELSGSDGVFFRAAPQVRRLTPDTARAHGPGKFLRP